MISPSNTISSSAITALLGKIERIEATSLIWGFVDGSLSREEAIKLAESIFPEQDDSASPEDLVEDLIDTRLIHTFDGLDGSSRLRSRFAEGVRLLSRLRQLFPKRHWSTAPRLVSDFRVDVRPRLFPRRDIDPINALRTIQSGSSLSRLEIEIWESIVRPGGIPIALAGFQVESTKFVLGNTKDSGTIITSGTGSGKTLCFYIPALIRIGSRVEEEQYWTKTLAIYPRTELLKDQFSEVYKLARRPDKVLRKSHRRPIIISALFGSTPQSCQAQSVENAGWEKRPSGYVCPFIVCPECGADMIWRTQDIDEKREQLICSRTGQCKSVIREDTIVLTRSKALQTPPDILFCTTEMLNRRMSDSNMRRLFGLGMPSGKRPFLALLDEVHTYTGTSGAQAALVFRRWRFNLRSSVIFVGLSATLLEADQFFSSLTGLSPERVSLISPKPEDMISEGAEYQVILRGDPVSQTSLLSTTIQTSMLMARLMDVPERECSNGFFGQRVFVFTDDLDVTNRLYDDLKDAEGYDIFGRFRRNRRPLAALRKQNTSEAMLFEMDGQRWKICESIGRDLATPLRVSRTTSQDSGVVAGSDVIVATAALEVGYDDPGVGVVIQHKSPRNMAAYLQRKGRAGRTRSMRPFIVTVLSDYGRDRFFCQAYEQLFDPVLPPQKLPIRNQYILRMQAIFAMIDWLADKKGRDVPSGWFWHSLSCPAAPEHPGIRSRQKYACKVLGDILKGENTRLVQEFRSYLAGALGISDEEVTAIMWEPPRSIMLEAIPTMLRRLHREWRLCDPQPGGPEHEFFLPNLPVPEFLPPNLFSDLNLPEVKIIIPPATVRHAERIDTLPIVQAMNQLAPGRVTRRFAPERGALSHWVQIDPAGTEQDIYLSAYAEEREYVGHFPYVGNENLSAVPVYRPWTIRLQKLPGDISPTSNAFLNWLGHFRFNGEPVCVNPPIKSGWSEIVQSIKCYLHAFRSSVSVARYALTSTANLRYRGHEVAIAVRFLGDDGLPAGIGFEQEVDGLVINYKVPSAESLSHVELSPALKAASRSAYFSYLVLSDTDLPGDLNLFKRDWLQQIYVSALIRIACRDNLSLEAALQVMLSTDPLPFLVEVMRSIFSIQEVQQTIEEQGLREESDKENSESPTASSIDSTDNSSHAGPVVGRLQQSLTELFSQPAILARLHHFAPSLWSPYPEGWGEWLQKRIHHTMAQAVFAACNDCAPQHAGLDTLIVDTCDLGGDIENGAEVFVTESTLGGAGMVQALSERFSEEPSILFSAIEATLAPGDFELATMELNRFLALVCIDENIAESAAAVRESQGHAERENHRQKLYKELAEKGIHIGHTASVALSTRLLRPGMELEHYRLLLDLYRYWEKIEKDIGVAIDHRVFCYLAATGEEFASRVRSMLKAGDTTDISRLVAVLSGILWPRPSEIRQRKLESFNPFSRAFSTDPSLINELLLVNQIASVSVEDNDWITKLGNGLAECGTCRLTAPISLKGDLRKAIVRTISTPVDIEFLQLYPVVERVEEDEQLISAIFTIREAL